MIKKYNNNKNLKEILELFLLGIFIWSIVGIIISDLLNGISFGFIFCSLFYFPYVFWIINIKAEILLKFVIINLLGFIIAPTLWWTLGLKLNYLLYFGIPIIIFLIGAYLFFKK